MSVVVFALICLLIPVIFGLSAYLGPKKHNEIKDTPYESGVNARLGSEKGQFNIRYFLVALIFLIFDIEIVFMYPWAIGLTELGLKGLVLMFIFMSILIVGLVYIYKKGILKWV